MSKRVYKFGKMFLYIFVGGAIAFVICSVALILRGYNIAGEMARDVLVVASEDGCVNYNSLEQMMIGFKHNYEVSVRDKDDATKDNFYIFDYTNGYDDYISVTAGGESNSIINSEFQDYAKFVQRGTPVTVTATVKVRLNLPFRWLNTTIDDGVSNGMWQDLMNGTIFIPVSKTVTGVTTKFFKGV
jgi:hypothetical protein